MIDKLIEELSQKEVQLVAVSKTRSNEQIMQCYEKGQRVFGENRVKELVDKHKSLPKDIEWHMIGHLQSKKVKHIAGFINLIHSIDSIKLLHEVNKQAANQNRKINVLLQLYIAKEKEKYGLDRETLEEIITAAKENQFPHIIITGLMGMATFTSDKEQVKLEFAALKQTFDELKSRDAFDQNFKTLSMGMSGDYKEAIEIGSNMVRIGSLLFD